MDFNEVYNPNVREISRDFSADFIVLYRDIMEPKKNFFFPL